MVCVYPLSGIFCGLCVSLSGIFCGLCVFLSCLLISLGGGLFVFLCGLYLHISEWFVGISDTDMLVYLEWSVCISL